MSRTRLRDRLATLTSRLVVTTVLLTALVTLAVGTATTLALRANLLEELDEEVAALVPRAGGPDGPADGPAGRPGATAPDVPEAPDTADAPGSADTPDGPCGDRIVGGNQGPGTLFARLPLDAETDTDTGTDPVGVVLTESYCGQDDLSGTALAQLADVPADGEVHEVDVDGVGDYRVVAVDGAVDVVVAGLPTTDTTRAVRELVVDELLIGLLAVVAAGLAATVVVRRQLRPLREVAATAHEVATLPLAEREVALGGRVPAYLVDERSEVGRVGAALEALLAHVEGAIDARHRSEQQVRQFVADASHELRTPLATIAGYAELARRRPGDVEAAATALAKVEGESGRMRRLVEDLLTLARLDAGRPLAREQVDVTLLLLEAVDDARVLAPDHRWRLDLPDDALEVVGDVHALHQVVTNLLTNARRYTPAGTTVRVAGSLDPDGSTVRIAVHDDGPGFAPELLTTAFDRFVRGDAARTRTGTPLDGGAGAGDAGGSGLGLALVRAIVEAHGGTVDLRSEPGATTVEVAVPRTAATLTDGRIV